MRLCDPINEESLRHQTTQLTVKLQHHRTHYDVLDNTNHIVVFFLLHFIHFRQVVNYV